MNSWRRPIITSLLDNDFYAFTMSYFIWQKQRDAMVTYRFISREGRALADYISVAELKDQLSHLCRLEFTPGEMAYLRSLELFPDDYLAELQSIRLPQVNVWVEEGQLQEEVTAPWWIGVFLETPVLAINSQLYHANLLWRDRISRSRAETVGMDKLDRKIALLQKNPTISLAEFGSRRRFSCDLQRQVVLKLKYGIGGQLLGTSNVLLAKEFGLKPIGTMAHQLGMGYGALEIAAETEQPLVVSEQKLRKQWLEVYGGKLNIYLTDTFGTKFALEHMSAEEARQWAGFRQDSGDPIEYGEYLLTKFKQWGLDPAQHFMLCSDGLNIDQAIQIRQHFAGRLEVKFGIGTNLTNDLVHSGLNAVWKPVAINGLPVVKLSDEPGKFTGQPEVIAYYLTESGHPEAETYIRNHNMVVVEPTALHLTPAA